jgi:hypothetical protein
MDAMFAEDMADIVLTTSLLLFLFVLLERA